MSDVLHRQERYCPGCGVVLQTKDETKPGFVPQSAWQQERAICQRCFKVKHYNELSAVEINEQDLRHLLHRIGESEGLVVKIVDLFDFNGSWISGLPRFVGRNPILVVANKVDLFPKETNLNRLKGWVEQSSKELGIKPIDVFMCSAVKGKGISELIEVMDQYRQGQNIYVVGTTNVGKSTLINQILKEFGVQEEEWLTTSRFPGTTLDVIEIPLQDGTALYDTPGMMNRQQMAHYVQEHELKIIAPMKTVKPKVYQLHAGQTLFFGGLIRMDFVHGERQSFICYLSNLLPIHRTKLEKADELYRRHLGDMLSPPTAESLDTWPSLTKHSFKIDKQPIDVVFSGLGWMRVKGSGAQVVVHAPKGVSITLRPAII